MTLTAGMAEVSLDTVTLPGLETYAVEMLHITKRFPGIVANDNITLQLKKGSDADGGHGGGVVGHGHLAGEHVGHESLVVLLSEAVGPCSPAR